MECIIIYLHSELGTMEGGRCQGAYRPQRIFYFPLNVGETALPLTWSCKPHEIYIHGFHHSIKGEKEMSTSPSRNGAWTWGCWRDSHARYHCTTAPFWIKALLTWLHTIIPWSQNVFKSSQFAGRRTTWLPYWRTGLITRARARTHTHTHTQHTHTHSLSLSLLCRTRYHLVTPGSSDCVCS